MEKFLDHTHSPIKSSEVKISGSKSESNRLLILQKLYPRLQLENLSDSDDTHHLKEALSADKDIIDIGHAGTAMRFLTAFFAAQTDREIILTGSSRMQNRPVQILVEALQSLGADITYTDKKGYPPLHIKGKKFRENKVSVQGNVSSQYISALMLIAPALENGLIIKLTGEITSAPYLKMTLSLLQDLSIDATWKDNLITIAPCNSIGHKTVVVESDWSSASYFYSLMALSEGGEIELSSYKQNSLQGDSRLNKIYSALGVHTRFNDNKIVLKKESAFKPKAISLNLIEQPDIAQTIVVTCFGLGIACDLTGLHTLKIKETDRLLALKNELTKLGAEIHVTENSLHLKSSGKIQKDISIDTYDDHRMAMAFAPLSVKVPIRILNAEVVTKSYKNFWQDFESVF
ncbi:MAG: 3-phosphoshikimate 1-carboxyvinyltransferase [Flavobacteriaceae bacterium]|nr:3-phosphoshikimate 1-carboxyvinyltransferase [Flavobacteriaceae bacterium]